MANLKNITELPVAESADGLNLIVNDNGTAKQMPASAVSVQADWAETNESNAAFIKNKPVEEWDLDLTVDITWNAETSTENEPIFTAAEGYSYDAFAAKVESGDIPKIKFRFNSTGSNGMTFSLMDRHCNVMAQSGMYALFVLTPNMPLIIVLNEDGTFTMGD